MIALVTGSSGHLGEALVRTLREADHTVRGMDVQASQLTDVVGNITDTALVREVMHGVEVVCHTATLHKPHVATHSKQQFVDTNISGTLALLEAAVAEGVGAFVFTSTTSLFGDAMQPARDGESVWVTEDLQPIPKNIYGVTKAAAEDLCHLFHRRHELPVVVLRTSRFFPEMDDNAAIRDGFPDANAKANEMLFRRVDVADVVSAHLRAAERAADIGFARYIISATTPFTPADLADLRRDAPSVVARYYPAFEGLYARQGWRMFPSIGRVYVNDRARRELGWQPQYDFSHVLDSLASGDHFTSPITALIGKKGYHEETFEHGPYPVE